MVIEVKDESAETTMILLNKEAENLIGVSANDLAASMKLVRNLCPAITMLEEVKMPIYAF